MHNNAVDDVEILSLQHFLMVIVDPVEGRGLGSPPETLRVDLADPDISTPFRRCIMGM